MATARAAAICAERPAADATIDGNSDRAGRAMDLPAINVPPRLIAVAASTVIVFLLAIGFFVTSNLAADLNLIAVGGYAVLYFSLTLSLSSRAAHDPRWAGKGHRAAGTTLDEFASGNVAIATGTVSGRAALVEVLVLPVTLAAGMVVIGMIFAMGL